MFYIRPYTEKAQGIENVHSYLLDIKHGSSTWWYDHKHIILLLSGRDSYSSLLTFTSQEDIVIVNMLYSLEEQSTCAEGDCNRE